jgi:threonine/homoserine/homoserine lactone efflux protein
VSLVECARAGAIGLALGAATGVPLGVVNLSVVEAAARAGVRRATAIGIGGALADTVHAALAFVGVAPRLAEHGELLRVLAAASAAIVIAYAAAILGGRTRAQPAHSGARGGVLIGVALTLPNPAPLAAWIAVASALLPDATPAVGAVAAAGVGVGSAAWFALLARLAARGRASPIVTRWLPRAVAIVMIAIAALALARVR